MKDNSNYKINLLPNDIIINEVEKTTKTHKKELNNIDKIKTICLKLDGIIQYKKKNIDLNQVSSVQKDLASYDDYFNQNLMNKADYTWSSDEFASYYYYFKFKLFLNYVFFDDNKKVEYYLKAMKIFTNIYQELKEISNVSFYEKIGALTSLYARLKTDFEHKDNKNHLIGEYRLLIK